MKKTRLTVALIAFISVIIIIIGCLAMFKPFEMESMMQPSEVNRQKNKAITTSQSLNTAKADNKNNIADMETPQPYSVYLNNADSKAKEVFVFYKNKNKNDVMIYAFDKVLNAISKQNVKYSEKGNKIIFSNGNLELTFEVNSNDYTSSKQKGEMRYAVENINGNVYFPLSELIFLFNYELDIPMRGLNIRPYPEKKVLHFVTSDHVNDKDIFSE